MRRLRPYPVAALAGWTLFVWTNRVWLAWTDDGLSTGEKLTSTLPPVAFVGLGIATVLLLIRSADGRAAKLPALVAGFAAFTTLYWAIRLPLILSHDHPGPFKVVHSVLALASVALAAIAWRAVRSVPADAGASAPIGSSATGGLRR